jgi:hypothetical protein
MAERPRNRTIPLKVVAVTDTSPADADPFAEIEV